jgi:hypothetical protein
MSDSYLDGILKVISSYEAQYLAVPISQKAYVSGCELPSLVSPPSPLSAPTQPDPNNKACVPLFVPFPIIPEPFVPPFAETCPNGLTFSSNNLTLKNNGSTIASGPVSVGSSIACQYTITMPTLDLNINLPCPNGGPTIKTSGAKFVVTDNNQTTPAVTTTHFTVNGGTTTEGNTSCIFELAGDYEITLPKIPCYPDGAGASTSTSAAPYKTLTIKTYEGTTVGSTDLAYDSCKFGFSSPTITLPQFSGLTCAQAKPSNAVIFQDSQGNDITGTGGVNSLTFDSSGDSSNGKCGTRLSGTIRFPSSGMGFHFGNPLEYDCNTTYNKYSVVNVSNSNSAVIAGKASPGVYVAVPDAGIAADSGCANAPKCPSDNTKWLPLAGCGACDQQGNYIGG